MYKIYIILILFFHSSGFAQWNLVKNPGSELNTDCSNTQSHGDFGHALNWVGVSKDGDVHTFDEDCNTLPQYSLVPPLVLPSYGYAHRGDAMAGFLVYYWGLQGDVSNLLGGELSQMLLPGII